MKKFLKHANRGLILSGIVLLIMIIYITVDYVRFNTQKDEIQQISTDYLNDTFALNLDVHAPSDAKTAYQKLIEQYFTSEYNTTYSTNQASLLSQADFTIMNDSVFDISEANCQIQSITVSKSGTGLATVNIKYRGSITGKGSSCAFTPGGVSVMNSYDDAYYEKYGYEEYAYGSSSTEAGETEDADYTKDYVFYYDGEANLSMKQIGGEWKIASWDSFYYNNTFDPVAAE